MSADSVDWRRGSAERRREIGRRIASYRRHLSMSQAEMAARYGVKKPTWSHYESGRNIFGDALMMAFSKGERLSLDAIFLGRCRTARERLMLGGVD
jgi:transcriptional regulator with XRE-family HTH domain